MIRIQARTAWPPLVFWPAGIVAFFVLSAVSLRSLYPTADSVSQYGAAFAGDDAYKVINGTSYGIDTIGGVICYEFGFVASLVLPLMGVLVVNRLTRAEEAAGRTELVRAGTVARSAPLASALALVAGAAVVVGVLCALVLLAYDATASSAWLYGAGMTSLALVFAAFAALLAQVVTHARAVVAAGLALLVVAYVLRGIGDLTGSWITYLSPIGWAEQIRPFEGPRLWPLALALGSAAVLSGLAFVLVRRRDLGNGLLAARPGPVGLRRFEVGVLGYAVRRHRATAAAWAAGAVLVGGMFGLFTQDVVHAAAGSATLGTLFGADGADPSAVVNGYLFFLLLLVVLIALAFAVQGVGHLREEERSGRLEQRLAARVGRTRWLGANAVVLAGAALVVLLLGALALGAADTWSRGTTASFGAVVVGGLAYAPAILLIGAVVLAAYGIRARLAAVGWVLVGWVFVVAFLADALRLPGWAQDLSPVHALGDLPGDDVPVVGLVVVMALLVAAVVVALGSFHRRDIGG